MKVFITGARGLIGGEAAAYFEEMGWEVSRFSRSADYLHLSLDTIDEQLSSNPPDAVLHLAWSTFPATSEMRPGSEWQTDLPLLVKICRAITLKPAFSRPHLLFLSSGAVYGDSTGAPSDECSVLIPKGWYAHGKIGAECLIDNYVQTLGLPATIVRASSVFGFVQSSNRPQGIIPKMIEAAQAKRSCTIWGDGTASKDYLHVRDLLPLLNLLISRRLTGIYNACTGVSTSLNDIAAIIEKKHQKHLMLLNEVGAVWDVERTLICNNKTSVVTGWSSTTSIQAGISELLQRSDNCLTQ